MTQKEKAQDLVNKFRIVLMDEDTDCGNELLCTSIAIKNALISVNEIIEFSTNKCCEFQNLKYWEEVKQELEDE